MNQYRCEDAVLDIIRRIQNQPELKDHWNNMLNAEKNYFVGDVFNIVNKVDHNPYQSELRRILNGLITEINRTSITGFTKHTYRKWILEKLRQAGE